MNTTDYLLIINIIGIIITLFYDIGRLYFEHKKLKKE